MMNKSAKKVRSAQVLNKTTSKNIKDVNASSVSNFWPNYGYLIFVALYLLVDIAPKKDGILDYYIQHRLYIDILNVVSGVYIFKFLSQKYASNVSAFWKNYIPLAYIVFLVLSTISLTVAISKIEGILELSRYFSNFIAFFNLFVLIYKGRNNFKAVAIILTITLLYQTSNELLKFYNSLGKTNLWSLVTDFKWNTGNKNIFAATILFKLAFAVYLSLRGNTLMKLLAYLTIVISFISIFFISARTAYFSMAIVLLICVIGAFISYYKDKAILKNVIVNSSALFVLFLGSYFWCDSILTKYANDNLVLEQKEATSLQDVLKQKNTSLENDTNSPNSDESYVAGRVDAALAMDDIRFKYWKSILEGVSHESFLGIGVGNYKIYSAKYIDPVVSAPVINKYAHNDFVEIRAESGWITLIVYLSIFLCAAFFGFKVLFSKNASSERKYVAILMLAGLFAYFVDSFFNFPLGRTNTHILFIVILSFLIANYLGIKQNTDKEENYDNNNTILLKVSVFTMLILGVLCLYAGYSNYQSSLDQYLVELDSKKVQEKGNKPMYTYDQVVKLLDHKFFMLGEFGETISVKKAKYLYFEGRYEEALKLLDEAHKEAPFNVADDVYKVLIYSKMNQVDSAYKYSAIAFNQRPYSPNDYNNYMTSAANKKDIKAIQEGYTKHVAYISNETVFVKYLNSLLLAGFDFVENINLLYDGERLYPSNARIKELKKYFDLMKLAKEGKIKVITN